MPKQIVEYEVVNEQDADVDSPSALFGVADAAGVTADADEPPEQQADSDESGEDTAEEAVAAEPEVMQDSEASQQESGGVSEVKPTKETPTEKKFKLWNGREVTTQQLLQNPDLLEDIIMTANQAPVLQRKYVEMLESLRAPQQQQQANQEQAEQPREKTPEELLQEYDKLSEQYARSLIEAGVISEESYTIVPDVVKMASRIAADVMALGNAYTELRRILSDFIAPIFEQTAQVGFQMVAERATQALSDRLQQVVKQKFPLLAERTSSDDIKAIAEVLVRNHGPQIVDVDEDALVNAAFGNVTGLLAKVASQVSPQQVTRPSQQRRVPPSVAPEGVSPKGPSRVPNQDILDLFKGG